MKFLIFLTGFLILIFSFINCSEDNPTDPPSQTTQGRLVVKSDPTGARIYLLGTDTGKNTPDSMDLDPGIYDFYLCLQYYDTAFFSAKVVENLTTTKEVALQDALPLVEIILDYLNAFSGDSIKFNWLLNQDVLMDSIIVERPISNSGLYYTDRYLYNNELFTSKDQFGNPKTYILPPSTSGRQYYPRFEGYTYWFNFYGKKAHGSMTSFHIFISQQI